LISILNKLNKPHKLNKKNKRLVTQIDKIKGNKLKYKDNKRLNIKLYRFLKRENGILKRKINIFPCHVNFINGIII
jgi:hypothetical protein